MGPLKGNVAAAGLRVHTLTHVLPCMDKKRNKRMNTQHHPKRH